jgi:hypothetical protein
MQEHVAKGVEEEAANYLLQLEKKTNKNFLPILIHVPLVLI